MADTSFIDFVQSAANRVVAAWLNATNKRVYWGRDSNFATTTGAANAQILTLASGSLYTSGSEADGDEFIFKAGFANLAAMTLQVLPSGGTNTAVAVEINGAALTGGELVAGQLYKIARLGATWQLTLLTASPYGASLLRSLTAAAARTVLNVPSTGEALLDTLIDAKGDLIAGTAADTPARLAVGTLNGQVLSVDSSQSTGLVYIDNPSRPNLLTNPNWQIDQINEGGLYTYSSSNTFGPDGWSGNAVGAGAFKLRTLADPDNAALKCLEITCTTADAAIAATDNYFIYTMVEGYDAAALMFGTASAQSLTVQFKFKTSVTGVYGISVSNSAVNRRYIGTITVADTNENEYSVTLTADTSGTWLYTNGVGFYLAIALASGTNFQAAAGSWAAGAEKTTSAQVNFLSNTANIAYLKRIQLIPGALVQAYKPADIQKELAKAQRYYEKTFNQGVVVQQNIGSLTGALASDFAYANAAGVIGVWHYAVAKRAAPTVTTYNPAAANANWRRSDNGADTNQSTGTSAQRYVVIQGDTSTSIGFNYFIHASANARLS